MQLSQTMGEFPFNACFGPDYLFMYIIWICIKFTVRHPFSTCIYMYSLFCFTTMLSTYSCFKLHFQMFSLKT